MKTAELFKTSNCKRNMMKLYDFMFPGFPSRVCHVSELLPWLAFWGGSRLHVPAPTVPHPFQVNTLVLIPSLSSVLLKVLSVRTRCKEVIIGCSSPPRVIINNSLLMNSCFVVQCRRPCLHFIGICCPPSLFSFLVWLRPPISGFSPTIVYLASLLLFFHNLFHTVDFWVFLCILGLWTTSMTTHLTGPCWNRKQPSRGPPPGARASRHKPPQASKLTNPSLTWKVSSKQPSDVFYRHQLLIYSFSIVFRTIRFCFIP